jgi:hypothetical protein
MKPARKGFSPTPLSRMIAGRERFLPDGLPGTAHSLSNFPEFGHARRADFRLAEGVDHLNQGGYGATPRSVLDAARSWQLAMEADPTTFFRRDLPGLARLLDARRRGQQQSERHSDHQNGDQHGEHALAATPFPPVGNPITHRLSSAAILPPLPSLLTAEHQGLVNGA